MNYDILFHKLRDIREENELTQNEMAQILQVSRPNYTRWETKAKIIPLRKLNEFCNYFKISMDYATGLSKEKKAINFNKDLDNKLIASKIRMIRKEKNVTQKELADALNTNQSVISAYEAGKTLILTAFAIQLCNKFKISLDWLCGRK